MRTFEEDGISFDYPANWLFEREQTPEGWVVTLQSSGTAFLMLSLRLDFPSTDELADEVRHTLEREYEGLEAELARSPLAGQESVGHDMRFFAMDLTNTCTTRCLACPQGTLMLMMQMSDMETDHFGPVLSAVAASLKIDPNWRPED